MIERSGISLLGVGTAGSRVLDALCRADPDSAATVVAVHTDADLLGRLCIPRRLMLGGEEAEGVSSGGDPARGRQAAERSADALAALCAEARVVVVVAGLGGGTGSGAGPVAARLARESGAMVLAMVTLPFFFEGQVRRRHAEEALREMREYADAVVTFPNQRMFDVFDATIAATDAFADVDRALAESVAVLARILDGNGLIRLDLADVRRMARSANGTLAMAWAEAQGDDRDARVVEQLGRSPLLEQGNVLVTAKSMLLGLVGGPDLRLEEVHSVMTRLAALGRPDAALHLGVEIRPDMVDRISVAVLAAEAAAAEAPEPDPPPPAAAHEAGAADKSAGGRTAKATRRERAVQGSLSLDSAGKGRFRDLTPTLYQGEDLDVPTFIRRGLPRPKV